MNILDKFRLDGNKAVITGGSKGIGKSVGIGPAHVVNVPQTTANYNASKAGVVQLSKCLAVEWAPHKIRANSLSPENTLTELARSFSEELTRQRIEKIPIKRMAEPEELQAADLFLASDASSHCTGTDLIVDGGYTLW